MDLYHGWFQKNGGCGFILKPAIMREEIAYFSANTRDVIPGVSPQILHVKVSGVTGFSLAAGSKVIAGKNVTFIVNVVPVKKRNKVSQVVVK